MSNSNGTDVEDPDFPIITDYRHLNDKVVEQSNWNINRLQPVTTCGDTRPPTPNEEMCNNVDRYNQLHESDCYDEAESLFRQRLILSKELKSPFDSRYKTDYFPRSGPNANKPQPPRYLHTVDDERDIVIRFPRNCKVPSNPANYLLEVALITVPRADQRFMHANKFQLHHENRDGPDENPFFVVLTPEHLKNGEISIKLVIVKTCKNDLQRISSLSSFDNPTLSNEMPDCETVKKLEDTYALCRARVAFSLGYLDADRRFIRFTDTTVMSNEITEKEKPKPLDTISCPECSHSFSIKEQKQEAKKRSSSSSTSSKKKISSKRSKT